jgi:hypothetical protein
MMTSKDRAALAKRNGCNVKFHLDFPYCGCADGLHFCDQQCSLISDQSAKRRRLHVVDTPE